MFFFSFCFLSFSLVDAPSFTYFFEGSFCVLLFLLFCSSLMQSVCASFAGSLWFLFPSGFFFLFSYVISLFYFFLGTFFSYLVVLFYLQSKYFHCSYPFSLSLSFAYLFWQVSSFFIVLLSSIFFFLSNLSLFTSLQVGTRYLLSFFIQYLF